MPEHFPAIPSTTHMEGLLDVIRIPEHRPAILSELLDFSTGNCVIQNT